MSDFNAVLKALKAKESLKEILIPSKDAMLTCKELSFKELKNIEKKQAKNKAGSEKDMILDMLQEMVIKVTVGDVVFDGSPLVSRDNLDALLDEITLTGIKELSDGIAEVLSLGK